VINHLAALLFF